ncbi:unnamed protein product [Eretmochelys imbricata]
MQASTHIGEICQLLWEVEMRRIMVVEQAAIALKTIPISSSTIHRYIDDLAENVLEQLIHFALQLDESTDITNMAQLLCSVRFVKAGMTVEELLFCKEIPTQTTGGEICKILDKFVLIEVLTGLCVSNLLKEQSESDLNAIKDQILTNLSGLRSYFKEYFPGIEDESPDTHWIQNLFSVTADSVFWFKKIS